MYSTLLKMALRHYHPKATLVAMIVKGGRVLSIGKNISKGHGRRGVHAEENAIKKCSKPRGSTLYVIRVRKDGTPGISKPCETCMSLIKHAGIKTIIYIGANNKWEKSSVSKD